jgi:hypothetical protein
MVLVLTTDFMTRLNKCTVDDTAQQVNCEEIYTFGFFTKEKVQIVTSKQRKNGDIIFTWVFESGKLSYLKVNTEGKVRPTFIFTGSIFDYSSIEIGENCIYYTMKKFATIQIVHDTDPSDRMPITYINKENFVSSDPKQLGFFPRDLYLHPTNDELFYVKFLKNFCLMTLI